MKDTPLMSCHTREELEQARESVDRLAYSFPLGTPEFDQWLAESNELRKAIDAHLETCPVCRKAKATALVA